MIGSSLRDTQPGSAESNAPAHAALSGVRVREILKAALFTDDEFPAGGDVPPDAVRVEGVVNSYAFHAGRLEQHRNGIAVLLGEMPDDFWSDRGGGMSFLNACMDRHGNHWAEHQTIEQLVALGIGVGLARYCFPRELWSALPGGLPYFSVSPQQATPSAAGGDNE